MSNPVNFLVSLAVLIFLAMSTATPAGRIVNSVAKNVVATVAAEVLVALAKEPGATRLASRTDPPASPEPALTPWSLGGHGGCGTINSLADIDRVTDCLNRVNGYQPPSYPSQRSYPCDTFLTNDLNAELECIRRDMSSHVPATNGGGFWN